MSDVEERKQAIRDFWKANPWASPGECDQAISDMFPDTTRAAIRGLRGRVFPKGSRPWEAVKECPKCHNVKASGAEEIHDHFGFRVVGGRKKPQSWCRPCRRADAKARAEAKKAEKASA